MSETAASDLVAEEPAAVGFALLMADVQQAVAAAGEEIAMLDRALQQGFANLPAAATPPAMPSAGPRPAALAGEPPPPAAAARSPSLAAALPAGAPVHAAIPPAPPAPAPASPAERETDAVSAPAPVALAPEPIPASPQARPPQPAEPVMAPPAPPGAPQRPAPAAIAATPSTPGAALAPEVLATAQPEREEVPSPPAAAESVDSPLAPRPSALETVSRAEFAIRPAPLAGAVLPVAAPLAPGMVPAQERDRPERGAPAPTFNRAAVQEEDAAPAPQSAPLHGDVFLDGVLVGHWMSETLARAAGGPARGSTAFDPRMGPRWPGALQGQ